MIDFVCTPPFLRITLRVAMVTMHFHIAQTGFFREQFCSHFGYPREQFGTNDKLSCGGARYVKLDSGVISSKFLFFACYGLVSHAVTDLIHTGLLKSMRSFFLTFDLSS